MHKDNFYFKTRFAVLWSNLINEPFASLFCLLPFILRKDLEGSALQLVLFTMLRPVVSVLSIYWTTDLKRKRAWLRSNVVLAGLIARLPFLFFPLISNGWYLIFAGLTYMIFSRAAVPAWMEILKLNLPKSSREKIFSLGWTLGYVEGIVLALGIGAMLDAITFSWKILFALSALLGMVSCYLQGRVPIKGEETFVNEEGEGLSYKMIVNPWQRSFALLKSRPDFALFQWGFMAGGFGVMLIQPALPIFFIDVLKLSYLDLGIALTLCKGVGIVLTSSVWARMLNRHPIYSLAAVICLGFALFPLFLMLAPSAIFWVYFAYLIYGVAQGGSHLIWHLSGPIFSGHEESSRYTSVNILMVGLRGAVAPALGGIFCKWFGPSPTLLCGSIFCLSGAYLMLTRRSEKIAQS